MPSSAYFFVHLRTICSSIATQTQSGMGSPILIINQEDALVVMKKDAAAVIKAIADLTIQKKKIEEQEKGMRAQLIKAMEQYGVKKFESDSVTFTYTAPMVRNSIDSAKLKKELPDVAAKYTKTSNVSASVKIEVRG